MNRILPIAAATLLFAGCPLDGTRPGTPLGVTRITPGAPSIVYYSGMRDPIRTAVFDHEAFAALWKQAFGHDEPAPALPEVDFTREFVVVAALGEHATGGYRIEVTHATAAAGGAAVEVTATAPGKGCMVTMAMTQPVDFVKVARPSNGAVSVRFVDKLVVGDCGP